MSKKAKTQIYKTKTKSEEKSGSKRSSLVRLMALFLAGLMVLGVVSAVIFSIFGIQLTESSVPFGTAVTDFVEYGDVIC